jgi:tetratricopeptide (TPR) repeat protein
MTDEKKQAVLKWVPLLLSFVTTVSTLTVLGIEKPGAFKSAAVSVAVVGATVLWLILLDIYRKKQPSSTHDPRRKRYEHSKRKRAVALAGLIILPALTTVVGYEQLRERVKPLPVAPPPAPPVVVATVQFAGQQAIADVVTGMLPITLREKEEHGAPLTVKGPYREKTIDGESQQQEEADAESFGKEKSVHLVIWGKVFDSQTCKSDTRFYLAVANDWMVKAGVASLKTGLKEYTPKVAAMKSCGESGIADVATLVSGIAFYSASEWAKAAEIFHTVRLADGRLWEGNCYRHLGDTARAIAQYETVLAGADPSDADQLLLKGRAHFMLGDVYYELRRFGEANAHYNEAARWFDAGQPWELQNAIGVTFFTLAQQPGNHAETLYRKAESAYRASLKLIKREEAPDDFALVEINLASVLGAWSKVFSTDLGSKLEKLGQAKTELNNALERLVGEGHEEMRSYCQQNLANVLAEEGLVTPGDRGVQLLWEAIAKYNDDVLRLTTRDNNPQLYAAAQRALGETLWDLGTRPDMPDAEDRLRDSRAAYQNALEVLVSQGPPDTTALTRMYLSRTLLALANLPGAGGKAGYLCEAIWNLTKAKDYYNASANQQGVILTNNTLVRARVALTQTGDGCPQLGSQGSGHQ